MENTFQDYPNDQQTIAKIVKILHQNPQAKRIMLQYPKKYLSQSFNLTKKLRKIFSSTQQQTESRQFYTLFDSMKKECCTDIIGAQHINYDILIHFGEACFSQEMTSNHYYLFPTISQDLQEHLQSSFANQKFMQDLKTHKIKYILTEQKMYEYAKEFLANVMKTANVQLLRLPYDKQQGDEYLNFGYYAAKSINQGLNDESTENNNILTLYAEHPQQDNQLLSDIHLTMGSFSSNKSLFSAAPEIFVSSLEVPQIERSNFNYAKPLMMRLAQIGQLEKYQIFGLLVSNAGTLFCRQAVEKCKTLLEKHNKKYYVFMMNNLNQVKLGNFPQVQVYVVISCFNNSCFSMKDFYRLVVTPMDLEVAFDDVSISDYNFDLNHPRNLKNSHEHQDFKTQTKQEDKKLDEQKNLALSVQQKQQIILANTLQTLDYYRNKEYKGLDFSQKKPVEKIKKGKIGLAEQYKPLPNEATQF